MNQLTLVDNEASTKPCDAKDICTARYKHSLNSAFGPYAQLTVEDDSPKHWESFGSKIFSRVALTVIGLAAVGIAGASMFSQVFR